MAKCPTDIKKDIIDHARGILMGNDYFSQLEENKVELAPTGIMNVDEAMGTIRDINQTFMEKIVSQDNSIKDKDIFVISPSDELVSKYEESYQKKTPVVGLPTIQITEREKDDLEDFINNDFTDTLKKIEDQLLILQAKYKRSKNSPILKDIENLQNLINNQDQIKAIDDYVKDAYKWILSANKRMVKVMKDIQSPDKKDVSNTIKMLNEVEGFISAYDPLKEIQTKVPYDSEIGKKVGHGLSIKQRIETEYFNLGYESLTDWLYPDIEKISQKLAHEGISITRDQLKEHLKFADKDIGFFTAFLGAGISSPDTFTGLVANKIYDQVETARRKDLAVRNKLVPLYEQQPGNKDNVQSFNSPFIYTIENYERISVDKDGNSIMDYNNRSALITEFNDSAFDRAKFEFYKDLGDIPAEGTKAYREYRKKESSWWKYNTQVGNITEIMSRMKNLLSVNDYNEWLNNNMKNIENKTYVNGSTTYDYWMKERQDQIESLSTDKSFFTIYTGDFINPADHFRNGQWNSVKDNSYYRSLLDTYEMANMQLPQVKRLKYGILPQIYMSEQEALLSGHGAISLLKKHMTLNIVENMDTSYGEITDLSGDQYKYIPVHYTNLIDNNLVSKDLLSTIMKFSQMSNKNKELSEIEPFIRLTEKILDKREIAQTDATGKQKQNLVTKWQKAIAKKDGVRANDRFKAFIDTAFYGIEDLKTEIGFGDKKINIDKLSSKFGAYVSLATMGGNFISGVNNLIFGNFSNIVEAVAGKYGSIRDWLAGKRDYALSMPELVGDLTRRIPQSKINLCNEYFDTIQGEFTNEYGHNISGTAFNRAFTRSALFFVTHGTEHEIQSTGMIMMLRKMGLWDKISVEDGKLVVPKEVEDKRTEIMKQIHSISKDLHGIYSRFDKPVIQRYWLGKLVMMFRKYAYSGFMRRWGSKRVDFELGDVKEGFYRGFISKLYSDMKEYGIHVNLYFRGMTPLQKENLRRVLTEMVTIAALLIIGGNYDDKDELSFQEQHLLIQLNRFRSDLTFYFPTRDFLRMMRTPAVPMNTIDNLLEFFSQAGRDTYHLEFERYKRDSGFNRKGDTKLSNRFNKLVPLYNQAIRLMTPEEQLKVFNRTF